MSKLGYRYDVVPSGTQLGAAIYRYPNAGYRELDDLLDERAAIAHNILQAARIRALPDAGRHVGR